MDYLTLTATFLCAAAILAVLRKIAFRINLLDHPNQRKQHEGATPLVGGLGIFITFSLALWLLDVPLQGAGGLLLGCSILVAVGVRDDLKELSARARFIAQIVAVLAMVYLDDVRLLDLGAIGFAGANIELGWLAVPFTIFATVGVINALNMIDGVDGLAGSVSLSTILALAYMASLNGNALDARVLLILGTAATAFLLFNWRFKQGARPLMFLGDAGSLLLGFIITWFFIKLSQGEQRAISPVTALCFFAVPIIDTVVMMIRRMLKGRSPFAADREHFHHVLQYAGFGKLGSVFIILGISIIFTLAAIAAQIHGIPESFVFTAFMMVFTIYLFMILHSWKVMRFLKRSICRRRGTDRRSGIDRRQASPTDWHGPERRSGVERRQTPDRRRAQHRHTQDPSNKGVQSRTSKTSSDLATHQDVAMNQHLVHAKQTPWS